MPSAEDTILIYSSLVQIREKYITYILNDNISPTASEQEHKIRVKAIEKALTVRGIGYKIHTEELFRELFAPHNDKLLRYYKFDSISLMSFVNKIEKSLLENKEKSDEGHRIFIDWFNVQDLEYLSKKYSHLELDPFLLSKVHQYETGYIPQFREVGDASRIVESDLNIDEKNILQNLSTGFNTNAQFVDPRFKAYPLNDTVINSKPVVYSNKTNSYYCFSPDILHRNLFGIVEELLKAADIKYYNQTYLGKGQNGRSSYFENKVSSLVNRIVKGDQSFVNIKYKLDGQDGEYESDALIETQKHIFLIEVKAGSFASSARRGSIRSLKHDLEELVGKAINQTNRTENYILTSINPVFYNDVYNNIKVDKNKNIIKITVSFASMEGITNQLVNLSELGLFEMTKNLPLAISVTDLIVLADIFEYNETAFVDYLKERTGFYFNRKILIENEIEFLATYISKGYYRFKRNLEKGKKSTLDLSNTQNINKFYDSLFKGKQVAKPKINR